MNLKKSIIALLISFVLSFHCFNIYSDTKELEIVNLAADIQAHKYVQDYIREHNLSTLDVIEAYKEAMSKRKDDDTIIHEKKSNFVIFIDVEDKMIVSIGPNGPLRVKGEE